MVEHSTEQPSPEPLDPHERRRIEDALDRLEERLVDALEGMHVEGRPADPAALRRLGLPEAAAMFWARWDGMELGQSEARIHPSGSIEAATRTAAAEGLLQPGDRVIGERGRELYVLPEDPWAEGADVVVIDEGERHPEASSVVHLALGIIAECSVLFDDDGEFRDDVFDEYGDLLPRVARKLARRRLDADPDAPRPRLLLVQRLREAGEHRAAKSEAQQVLKRSPEYPWALHELGRARAALGDARGAVEAHRKAAQAGDTELRAYFLAWAAVAAEGDEALREKLAEEVRRLRPEFANHQALGAAAQLDRGNTEAALELVMLGLAVAPRNLELLELRRRCETPDLSGS